MTGHAPILVCGYLPYSDQSVVDRQEDIPRWQDAVRATARGFNGELMFVVALNDTAGRTPAGVWEDLPLIPQKWTRGELAARNEFTIIGFDDLSQQPSMTHFVGGNWIIAAQVTISERNHQGYRFVAAFDGHIPRSEVLGAYRRAKPALDEDAA